MDQPFIVIGSSKDTLDAFWRVWVYDDATKTPVPRGHYREKRKADTVAFDLVHATAKQASESEIEAILSDRDADPTPLRPKVAVMLGCLAEEAIRMAPQLAEPGKAGITVLSKQPEDTIHVVRFYAG
ncbi:MAG: hypothetical protein L6R43_04600 [Planctomycetes bacterium]|nr:hypothetical protein [Planctomycetota bacterium]